jgi:hypothetical protein
MTNTTFHSASAIITAHRSVIGYYVIARGQLVSFNTTYVVCFEAAAVSEDMADHVRTSGVLVVCEVKRKDPRRI